MSDARLRILLIEDSESDARLVARELRCLAEHVEFERVEDAGSVRAALQSRTFHVVVSDWSLPRLTAPRALAIVQELAIDVPFVIVTGTIGEEHAIEAMHAGAHDIVLKGNLSRLNPAIERELREKKARDARRAAEEQARKSDERYRILFEGSPLPQWVYDVETLAFLAVNEAAVQIYGYSREEFMTMTLADIRPPDDVALLVEDVQGAYRAQGRVWRHRTKDGSLVSVEIHAHDIDFANRPARLALVNDVSERRRLEGQLRQAQKMEAVGRLAGGVAHDFNNLLSVILSYSELLLSDANTPGEVRDDVSEIHSAAHRAAELTTKLLMFSRQQVFEPKVLDLNEVVTGMDRMLRRILGADIDMLAIPGRPLGRVRVDTGSVEQVIMNLVVNARDAMPTGGKLTLETANVHLDEEYARRHLGVKPGPHVMLAVTDSGVGMDKATQANIFEPFFTTKAMGKGTGLGLSTVFGIAKQSGGSVWIYSEVGRGTTFKVYLPCVTDDVDPVRPTMPPGSLRGDETVLLVEDDDQVRAVAREILEKNGYRVYEARSAAEAAAHSREHVGAFDLLLSDVVMPQTSGPELAKMLAPDQPRMSILCMSGYTDDSIVRHGVLDPETAYLQKPFTPDTLTRKVRAVLDGPGGKRPR